MGIVALAGGVLFAAVMCGSVLADDKVPVPRNCLALAAHYGLPAVLTVQQAQQAVLRLEEYVRTNPQDARARRCVAGVRKIRAEVVQ